MLRLLISTIEIRKGKMLGHLIRHDYFKSNIIESKIEGKRRRERSRHSYVDQIKEKIAVATY